MLSQLNKTSKFHDLYLNAFHYDIVIVQNLSPAKFWSWRSKQLTWNMSEHGAYYFRAMRYLLFLWGSQRILLFTIQQNLKYSQIWRYSSIEFISVVVSWPYGPAFTRPSFPLCAFPLVFTLSLVTSSDLNFRHWRSTLNWKGTGFKCPQSTLSMDIITVLSHLELTQIRISMLRLDSSYQTNYFIKTIDIKQMKQMIWFID